MLKTVNLKVEGMMCAHCSKSVELAFEKVGIKAKVNLSKNTVRFTYDDEKTPMSYLQRIISQIGYKLIVEKKESKINFRLISLVTAIIVLVVSLLGMINMLFMGLSKPIHIPFFVFFDSNLIKLIFSTIALLVLGLPFMYRAIMSFKMKRVGMDLLISLSSLSSYILSIVVLIIDKEQPNILDVFTMNHNAMLTYFDSTMMILSIIYIGHSITDFVKFKSSNKLEELSSLIPNKANLIKDINNSNDYEEIDADTLKRKNIILVKVGERIPCDSKVISEYGQVDEKILTGESLPRDLTKDSYVYASTTLISGPILCVVDKPLSNSLMSNIVNESYALDNSKSKLNKISDTIAMYFTPTIILLSLITFFINYFTPLNKDNVFNSIINSLSVLVVSCPCAFGLAVPLSSLNGYYIALKRGILFKSGDVFEQIRKIKAIFFDKTGTITSGKLQVTSTTLSDEDLILLSKLESFSNHPIAKSIIEYVANNEQLQALIKSKKSLNERIDANQIKEIPGIGFEYKDYLVGSLKILDLERFKNGANNLKISDKDKSALENKSYQSVVVLVKGNTLLGMVYLLDKLVEGSKLTFDLLHSLSIKTYIISGDTRQSLLEQTRPLGLDQSCLYSEVSPTNKKQIIEEIVQSNNINPSTTCYIGDGINDVLALSSVNLKIASYYAQEITKQKANTIILKNDLFLIYESIYISKRVFLNIILNFVWALCYNLILIPFAIMGVINPTLSALLMILSSLTLVLNSYSLKLINFDKKFNKIRSKFQKTMDTEK